MEDVLITDLVKNEKISVEVAAFCRKRGFDSLVSIVNFFLSEGNEGEIEKIDFSLRNQLKELCKQYIYQKFENNTNLDIPLQELYVVENMSQRAFGVCYSAGLTTLGSILQHRWVNSGFSRFRNCGNKSNKELIQLCDKYDNLILNNKTINIGLYTVSEGEKSPNKPIDEQISIDIVENITLQTLVEIERMSVRAYNVCESAGLTSLRLIIQYYYNNKRSGFLSLRKVGKKSNEELISICLKYESSVRSLQKGKFNNEDSDSPIDTFLSNLRLSGTEYQKVRQSITGLDYIPIFKVLDILIDSHYVFRKEKDTLIFKEIFNCYLPPVNNTLEEIGQRLGVTRERVRQIRESIYQGFFHSFWFIKTGKEINIFPNYIQSINIPIILITDEEAERINKNENTNFSPLFITFVLSELFSDNFTIVGDRRILFKNAAYKETFPAKHLFLVNRKIASQFQFDMFLTYVHSLLCQSRKEEQYIPYNDLLARFKANNITDDQAIIKAINLIVSNDYNQFVEIKPDGLNFYRTSRRTFTSHIIEILQNSYKPLHYSEIYQQLINRGVDIASDQSILTALGRESEIFGLKGFGIYDLRSKGGLFGSIGDVAEQLLITRNAPIHLKDLENLICKELVVSKDSIRELLFNYSNEDRFIRDRSGNVKLKKWQKVQV